MKLKTIVLTSVLALLCGLSTVNAATNDILGIADSSKFVFQYENEFRGKDRDNSSPLFYDHNDFQVKYLFNQYFDVHTDYRLVFQDKSTGAKDTGFKDTSVFLEGFDLKLPESPKWGKITMNDRIEISLNGGSSPNTYYLRNFPKYDFPLKLTRYQFQPFVANESFWDVEHNMQFVKNRIYAGIDWQITPKIQGGTWYYYETYNGTATHANVGVMAIRFLF
jgi:hypothetical protein